VRFVLNGKPTVLEVDTDRALLWVLRSDLGLTGPKYGCGMGQCGACTVVVDEIAVRSCVTPVGLVQGRSVVTIEGLMHGGSLHPLQTAFMEHDALQCGYCTPGMLMSAYSLLRRNPHPTEAEIREGMEGNLCRCGAYQRILQAIQAAAKAMAGGS
jgi:aerobic-type carbon monoxide dehydrogenase small subunit (CoxS/CutS family)